MRRNVVVVDYIHKYKLISHYPRSLLDYLFSVYLLTLKLKITTLIIYISIP